MTPKKQEPRVSPGILVHHQRTSLNIGDTVYIAVILNRPVGQPHYLPGKVIAFDGPRPVIEMTDKTRVIGGLECWWTTRADLSKDLDKKT